MNKKDFLKEIFIGLNRDKGTRVILLSDALPQILRHLWAIIRDLVLSVAFKVHILKRMRGVHYASFFPKYFQIYSGRHSSP